MKTSYQKGADKENELLRYLEYHGFTGCRSAGSHGNWDIIASPIVSDHSHNYSLHIQAGPKSKNEIDRLAKVAGVHVGRFCHVLFEFRKSPKIRDLNGQTWYRIETFLELYYGIKANEYYFVVKKLKKIKDKSE